MNLFAVRARFDRAVQPFVSRVARLPLTANQWTLLGVGVGAAGAAFLYAGWWWAGLAALLARGLVDNVDGYVARSRRQRSVFGAVADDVADRWTLGVMYGGACLHLAGTYPHVLVVLVLGITGSLCNVVAKLSLYAESRHASRAAGKLGHPVDLVGVFGSAEFILWFGTGILLTAVLSDPRPALAGVWAVAVLAHVSLLQRIAFAWRHHRSVDPA